MIIMGKEHENKISLAMQAIFAFVYAVFIYNWHNHLWAFQHMHVNNSYSLWTRVRRR